MNTELVIVLLIIAVSSFFTLECSKQYNMQLYFILAVLAIMLVYKIILYKRVQGVLSGGKSGFADFSVQINDFLNKGMPEDYMNPMTREQYNAQIKTLQDKVDIMNDYLADLKTQLSAKTSSNTITDQYNIQASQQVQDYRIRKLVEDIQRANDLIKQSQARKDSANYKKIPVMSSCIVQQADGSITVDNLGRPVSGSNNKSSTGGTVLPGSTTTQSLPGSPDAPPGLTGEPTLENPQTLQSFIQAIANRGIDIRLKN